MTVLGPGGCSLDYGRGSGARRLADRVVQPQERSADLMALRLAVEFNDIARLSDLLRQPVGGTEPAFDEEVACRFDHAWLPTTLRPECLDKSSRRRSASGLTLDSLSDCAKRSPLVPRYLDAGHEEELSILARIPCLRRDQRFLVGQIDEQLQFHLLSAGTVEAFDRIALLACDCLRGVEILTETR